jgi:putative glutamine amidotransferase
VDQLGEGLRVSGRSTLDELPEAIELPGGRFVLGVQWHPEADAGSRVVGAFVAAAASAQTLAGGGAHASAAVAPAARDGRGRRADDGHAARARGG